MGSVQPIFPSVLRVRNVTDRIQRERQQKAKVALGRSPGPALGISHEGERSARW